YTTDGVQLVVLLTKTGRATRAALTTASMSSLQRASYDRSPSAGGSDKPMPRRSNTTSRPSPASPSKNRTPTGSSNIASIDAVPLKSNTTSWLPLPSPTITRYATCESPTRAYSTSLVRDHTPELTRPIETNPRFRFERPEPPGLPSRTSQCRRYGTVG